jgi:hypothetical protein
MKGRINMRLSPRLNRYERREMHAEKLKNNMSGTGIYVYENNSDGDLRLPKATASGIKTVGPRKRFQGDSYFMNWVGSPMNLLKLVEVIVPKDNIYAKKVEPEESLQENTMTNENQLLLDQPDTITNQGKVERVVVKPTLQPINDNAQPKEHPATEVLLTEDPVDGVTIILG